MTTRPLDERLPSGTVHVWRIPLIASRQEQSTVHHWLSDDERDALDRMSAHTDRERRAIAWGRLRYILSRYLDHPPHEIDIHRRPSERPEILRPSANGGLRFNLSHSGAQALVAVSRSIVGVDIERVRTLRSVRGLAQRFFTAAEATALNHLAADTQVGAFFRLWVLKEAYLKAAGVGVPEGLSQCEMAVNAEEARLIQPVPAAADVALRLQGLPVSAGYAAAAAFGADVTDISVFDL